MSGRLFAVMAGLLGREPTGARARRHGSLSLLPLSLNLLRELRFLLLHVFGLVFCAQAASLCRRRLFFLVLRRVYVATALVYGIAPFRAEIDRDGYMHVLYT